MIPKTTTPLTKSIRTLEGQLVTASNVAAVALSAVDPSALPHKYAGAVVVIQNIALILQRGLIKVKSLNGVLPVATEVTHDLEDVLSALESEDPADQPGA